MVTAGHRLTFHSTRPLMLKRTNEAEGEVAIIVDEMKCEMQTRSLILVLPS